MKFKIEPYYELEVTSTEVVLRSFGPKSKSGRRLKFSHSSGHPGCMMKVGNKLKYVRLHQLVAKVVHGPCPLGLEVNHIDGNKLNNHPSNLEYVTHQENMAHALKNKLMGGSHKYVRSPEEARMIEEGFIRARKVVQDLIQKT